MAATLENAWWVDVLRTARQAATPATSTSIGSSGKVFLPWLGKPAAEVTAKEIDALNLPKPGAYRLGWWRTAGDRINWRRFFDINELVCLRMEDDEAFEAGMR